MEKKVIRNVVSQSYAPDNINVYWNDGIGFREFKEGKWQYMHSVILAIDIYQGKGSFAKNREMYDRIEKYLLNTNNNNCIISLNGKIGTAYKSIDSQNVPSIEITVLEGAFIMFYTILKDGRAGSNGCVALKETDVYDF